MKRIRVLLGCSILCMLSYYQQYYYSLGDVVFPDRKMIDEPDIVQENTGNYQIPENEFLHTQDIYHDVMNEYSTKNISKEKGVDKKAIIDCVVSIPKIDLEKNVYTGTMREKELEQYHLITATDNMLYSNGGNYIICGHNSRVYGHSLNRLHELEKGDKVYICFQNKRYEYKVYSIQYENMYQTSEYMQQTQDKELTIFSCSKNRDKKEYIIVKCQYMN